MSKEIWERDPSSLPLIKEVRSYKRKRLTKGQVIKKYKEKGDKVMPKLGTQVREGADDIVEGVEYEIVNVEEIVTDVQSLSGIRVSCLSKKGDEGNVVLWQRPITGTGSKLGVFITELGDDTDNWLNKWVVFKVWQNRNRVLEVISAPKGKPAKKAKAKTG